MSTPYGVSLEPDFIEDVPGFVAKHADVDASIGELNQKYQHLKIVENQILAKRQRLQQKESEIKQTLACVVMMAEKSEAQEEVILDYQVAGKCSKLSRQFSSKHDAESVVRQQRMRTTVSFRSSNLRVSKGRLSCTSFCLDAGQHRNAVMI